jgi:AcrR family transcriptional regulator
VITSEARGKGKRNSEQTQEAIFEAALAEFTSKGLDGARVDKIAQRAGANKRMIYHYFGGKEDLFLAVLERTYAAIRSAECELHLENLDPVTGMRELITFSFDYFKRNPHFIKLLNNENLHSARHLRSSRGIRDMHSPLASRIADILERGRKSGVFRADVDSIQLYISIAALGYFYFSNAATLSAIFGRDLLDHQAVEWRRQHVVEVILSYLRP